MVGTRYFFTTYSTGMVNMFLSLEAQTVCLLTLDECIFFPHCLQQLQHPSLRLTGKSSWTPPFLAYQLHPSFDFCLVRGSILFCTFRRNDTFVLRGEQDKCLDCIAKHVSFRSSHRLVDVISWLTHAGNLSTEISCFKKIVVHIQRTCSLVRNYFHVQKYKRRLSHATFFLSEQISWLKVNKKKILQLKVFYSLPTRRLSCKEWYARFGVMGWVFYSLTPLCVSSISLVEITQPFGQFLKKRRHTTIRTERGASQNYSELYRTNSTVIYCKCLKTEQLERKNELNGTW